MNASPPAEPAAFRGSGPFLAAAPPLSLPMRHFAFSALAFWAFAAAFALGHERLLGWGFRAAWALGLVHTLTLGWIAMSIFGAMTQMAPVLWETPLKSPWAVRAGWWLFSAGIAGFVGSLWLGAERYWPPAVLLASGAALYLYAVLGTMRSAPRSDWTGVHLANASAYLAALAAAGVLLAYDRHRAVLFRDPEGVLIAHVHLALVGWVTLTIMGVSYRLVSMFALARLETKTPGRLALALANAGLAGLSLDCLFLGRRLTALWATLLAAGYAAYAWQMRGIFRGRNRRLDPSLSFTLLALAGGFLWAGLGLSLAFGWLPDTTESRSAYVFAALVGWATPYILGQIHKIVPFLVWLHVYSPRDWKPPVRVPRIQDLTSERLAWAELALLAPAVVLGTAGFLLEARPALRASSLLLFACATAYLANTAMTLKHLLRRDPRWTS